MVTEAVERRGESLKDWVSGVPERSETPAPETSGIPVWDLRPVGELGSLHGAGGRQEARMKYLISVGALQEGIVEGIFVRDRHDPGRRATVREEVMACVPIPVSEMIPNWGKPLEGFVTPLWPVGKPEWFRDLSKLPEPEE